MEGPRRRRACDRISFCFSNTRSAAGFRRVSVAARRAQITGAVRELRLAPEHARRRTRSVKHRCAAEAEHASKPAARPRASHEHERAERATTRPRPSYLRRSLTVGVAYPRHCWRELVGARDDAFAVVKQSGSRRGARALTAGREGASAARACLPHGPLARKALLQLCTPSFCALENLVDELDTSPSPTQLQPVATSREQEKRRAKMGDASTRSTASLDGGSSRSTAAADDAGKLTDQGLRGKASLSQLRRAFPHRLGTQGRGAPSRDAAPASPPDPQQTEKVCRQPSPTLRRLAKARV